MARSRGQGSRRQATRSHVAGASGIQKELPIASRRSVPTWGRTPTRSRAPVSPRRSWGGSWGRSKSTRAKTRRRRDRLDALRLEEQRDLQDWPRRPYIIQPRTRHRTEIRDEAPRTVTESLPSPWPDANHDEDSSEGEPVVEKSTACTGGWGVGQFEVTGSSAVGSRAHRLGAEGVSPSASPRMPEGSHRLPSHLR